MTVLTCSRCGAQPSQIAVALEEIRGQPKGPLQVIEAPRCERYKLTKTVDEIRQLFLFSQRPNLEPRYNIGPGQLIPVVRLNDRGDRELVLLKWGLVPRRAADARAASGNVNARRETVDVKPAFAEAYRKRRCLIPADGFYVWEQLKDGSKQPWLFTLPNDGLFAVAGLWDEWRDSDGRHLETCTIVTCKPPPSVNLVYGRSPMILQYEAFDRWLSRSSKLDDLVHVGQIFAMKELPGRRVPNLVDDQRNEGPDCVAPAPGT